MNTEVGLRELRQNASELVRRVEAGESVVDTVRVARPFTFRGGAARARAGYGAALG